VKRTIEKNPVATQFGENLRRLRLESDLSQAALARRAELHISEVSLLERGGRMPRFDTIIRLVSGLGVSANALFAGVEWVVPLEESTTGFYDVAM
jgi:transcriptional regulator with XRE-family HTH domain